MTGGAICCSVGVEQYAFRADDVRQIARAEQVRVASGADGRIGILSIEGREVPVFALAAALGRDAAAGAIAHGRHVAVVGEGDATAGWLVDRIARATPTESVLPLPAVVGSSATARFEGLLPLDERLVLLLRPGGKRGRESFFETRKTTPVPDIPSAGAADMVVIFATPALPAADVSKFAISARRLAAVVPALDLIPVPGSAPFVAGVTRWRNSIVTAIDFRGPGHHAGDADGRRWMLVHATRALGAGLLAIRVDPALVLHRATADDRAMPARSKSSFPDRVFEIDREPVGFLQLGFLESVISTHSHAPTRLAR